MLARLAFPVSLLAFGALRTLAIEDPTGGLRRDNIADLAPHPQPSGNYNEFWTYQFGLNNGVQVQLNLSRADFGRFKDPVCGSDLSVMGFRGKNYFVAREYPLKNFSFDSAHARLAVHTRIFTEGAPPLAHHVFFSTRKDGVSYLLDLTFSDMTPGVVWGDGVFHLRDHQQVGLYFHIPGARVRGKLAINGDTTDVRGFGWMDHSYQTDFATRLIDHGYRYVTCTAPWQGGYFFQNGQGVFGYGVRNQGGRLTLLSPQSIQTPDAAGAAFPSTLVLAFADGSHAKFQVLQDRLRTSAFQELNWLQRKAAALFLGGELISDRGTGRFDGDTALYSFIAVRH